MATASPCPTREQVEDLLANRLTVPEAHALRTHLSTCPKCQNGSSSSTTPPTVKYPFLSPPLEPDELGRLDEYRVLGVLGDGGMSIVFEADDTKLHRKVALKVLRPEISDRTTRERFLREARLVAGLPHEHIVTIFQVGEANGVSYLTMERLEGCSLEDRLKREKWLPLAEALALTREAAEGLIVAHEAGLVHRDIKPANLWLETRNGRFHRVKLIDFGIARRLNQDSTLTAAGQIVGTPLYMSPEQARGLPVDGRSDLYSLGCVLFHMIIGKSPFDGRDPKTSAVLAAVMTSDIPRIREIAPQLPAPVASLLQQLLAHDPTQRPANARVLVERLEQLKDDQPAPSTPATQPAMTTRLMRQPKILGIWLGILAISAALLVGVYAMIQKFQPKENVEEDPTPTSTFPGGPPIKVGVVHSLTGTLSIHERQVVRATEFAVEEINKSGGVMGQPIDLIIEDGQSDEKVFAQKARKLIEEDKVAVLFGCWSSAARKPVAEVCKEHDKLLFYSIFYEGLENSPNVVYLGGTPNQTLIPMVRWAYADKGKRRVFLIGSDGVFSHAINEILGREIKRLNASVIGTRYYSLTEANFDKDVEEMKTLKVDLIINTLDGPSNVMLKRSLRKAELRPPHVLTVWNSISETELSQFRISDMIGDYSVGCYFESLAKSENKAFLERFRKRYGAKERVNDTMETAYFGVHLWKLACEKAHSTDTKAVREALRGLTVDSPEGTIQIDKSNQHAYRTARIGEIVETNGQGAFEIVYSSPKPLQAEAFPQGQTEDQWKSFLDGLFQKWGNKWERHP